MRIAGAGLQFLFYILVAKFYGAEGMGIYILAFTVTSVVSAVGRFGLDQAMLRMIAVSAEKAEWAKTRELYKKSYLIVIILSLLLSILLYNLSPWIATTIFDAPALGQPMSWMSISILPLAVVNLHAECLRAIKKITLSTIIQVVLIPIFSCGLLLLISRFNGSILTATQAYVFSVLITAVAGTFFWCKVLPETDHIMKEQQVKFKEIFSIALPMAGIGVSMLAMSYIDTFVLGVFRETDEVGIFSAAQRLVMLLSFVLIAGNSILAPKVAALYEAGELRMVEKLARFSALIMVVVAAPFLILLLVKPSWVLSIYGQGFTEGAIALQVLCVGQAINVATGSVGVLLIMTGHERIMQRLVFVSGIFHLVISIICVPLWGVTGAAFASTCGMILLNVLALIAIEKHLNIKLFEFNLKRV